MRCLLEEGKTFAKSTVIDRYFAVGDNRGLLYPTFLLLWRLEFVSMAHVAPLQTMTDVVIGV